MATSQPFADIRVIQDFKQTHLYIPQFANPGFLVPDGSFSLIMFRLTTLESSQTSVIGISWHHILGDAQVCSRYLKQLSAIYDALVRAIEPHDFFEYPDYNSAVGVDHMSDETVQDTMKMLDTSAMDKSLPRQSTLDSRQHQMDVNWDLVTISFAARELEDMKQLAVEASKGDLHWSTRGDVIVAWWLSTALGFGWPVFRVDFLMMVSDTPCCPAALGTEEIDLNSSVDCGGIILLSLIHCHYLSATKASSPIRTFLTALISQTLPKLYATSSRPPS